MQNKYFAQPHAHKFDHLDEPIPWSQKLPKLTRRNKQSQYLIAIKITE